MLRVGVLLDDKIVPVWTNEIIRRLSETPDIEIVSIIRPNQPSQLESASIASLISNAPLFLFNCLRFLDEFLFRDTTKNPFTQKLIDGSMYSFIELSSQQNQFSDDLELADLEKIEKLNLDILLTFSTRGLKGKILRSAKLDIWSLHHGDMRNFRGTPPAYWEFVSRSPSVSATLYKLNRKPYSGQKIDQLVCFVHPLSWVKTKRELYWNSVDLVVENIRKFKTKNMQSILNAPSISIYDRPYFTPPQNRFAVFHIISYFYRIFKKIIYRLFFIYQWRILVGPLGGEKHYSADLSCLNHIQPSKDRYWADPFIVPLGNGWVIFVEELFYKTDKGTIVALQINKEGQLIEDPQVVIEEKHHLSYPQVVTLKEHHYMTVECSQSRSIDLYEALDFPLRWQKKMSLMENVRAADTTLFWHEGRWWMFMTVATTPHTYNYTCLKLFYAEDLLTIHWAPHPQNPILMDATRARPAGPIFKNGDQIIRPSQDCTGSYGRRLNLNRINTLTTTQYQEELIEIIEPNLSPQMKGIHTLSTCEELQVFDGLWQIRRFF